MADTKIKNILNELYDYDLFHLTEIENIDRTYRTALDRPVNEGKIIQHLDDIERKVKEIASRQMELWKQTDSCYQKTVLSADDEEMLGLENCFAYTARKVVFECMAYI